MTTRATPGGSLSATRRGCWTYDPATGWRLDGTDLVLDFDPLDDSGHKRGAWLLYRRSSDGTGEHLGVIDHYLDGSMEYVEAYKGQYVNG